MIVPQPGVFAEETNTHLHLQFTLRRGVERAALIKALGAARRATVSVHGPNVVWGFGPDTWKLIAPELSTDIIEDFEPINGPEGLKAPATQADIWIWCHGSAYEKVWRTAYDAREQLDDVADVIDETPAYIPQDNRDSIGFIDGTENPALDEALDVSLIPADQPGGGGTCAFVQKWIHDLPKFEALPISDQDLVFGRTKADSIELPDDIKPDWSHISRNVVEDADGNEMHILRRITPLATATQVGSVFMGFTNNPPLIQEMLDRMFGTSGDGLFDHFTLYSKPVSGSWYFVPPINSLTEAFGPLKLDEEG